MNFLKKKKKRKDIIKIFWQKTFLREQFWKCVFWGWYFEKVFWKFIFNYLKEHLIFVFLVLKIKKWKKQKKEKEKEKKSKTTLKNTFLKEKFW